MKSVGWVFDTLWRGVVVGLAYIAAMMLAGIVFGMLGLVPAVGGSATASLFWILMAGILLGICLGPLAARTTATRQQHVLIWTAVIFFNMGAVVLHDLPDTFLGAIGVLDLKAYEIALNSPTIWRTILWICYGLSFVLFLVFFPKAVGAAQRIRSGPAIFVGILAFVTYQGFYLIFNR